MDFVLQSIFISIFMVEFIIGNLGNGFIFLVNFMDWVKGRKISSVDRILTALAISRIALLWLVFLDWWSFMCYPGLSRSGYILKVIFVVWAVTSHFNNWLATSLCIFYFLKIASFSNTLFLYLKWRVNTVISVVLMVSLIFLISDTILIFTTLDKFIDEPEGTMPHNCSWSDLTQLSMSLFFSNFMIISVPFALSLVAFLLLIFSLWKHHKKMHQNNQGSRDARTTAHIKALQTVIAFLLLYMSFFLSLAAQVWTLELEDNLITLFIAAALTVFPSGHSCVLILGNNKLRQTLFCCCRR